MLFQLETLGEHIGEQIGCRHSGYLETKVSELCRFVREVLPNVYVRCSLSATKHIVGPLDASCVVLIHRSRFDAHVP